LWVAPWHPRIEDLEVDKVPRNRFIKRHRLRVIGVPHTRRELYSGLVENCAVDLQVKKVRLGVAPLTFNRQGEQIKDFRWAWEQACKCAGVSDVKFHDLRRTGVRNMRRDGVPQVVRVKISGHKTDSMERRYNIVDGDDIKIAKSLMQAGRKKASA
jgi:hypothetical protein